MKRRESKLLMCWVSTLLHLRSLIKTAWRPNGDRLSNSAKPGISWETVWTQTKRSRVDSVKCLTLSLHKTKMIDVNTGGWSSQGNPWCTWTDIVCVHKKLVRLLSFRCKKQQQSNWQTLAKSFLLLKVKQTRFHFQDFNSKKQRFCPIETARNKETMTNLHPKNQRNCALTEL